MDNTRVTLTEKMTGGTMANPQTDWKVTAHIDLAPYPFPEGVEIPRLMPEQDKPFNGDGYLAGEVLRLKEAYGLQMAIETGTCLGSTALWLAQHFKEVFTYETNDVFLNIAKARFEGIKNLWPALCKSVDGIDGQLRTRWSVPALMWLDAHWSDHCPLLDELEVIAGYDIKPCIVIHDFQVPGMDFGYDKMPDGRPFNFDLIRTHLDAIYGEGGWKHNYPTKVEGAKRGWISIEPVRP